LGIVLESSGMRFTAHSSAFVRTRSSQTPLSSADGNTPKDLKV